MKIFLIMAFTLFMSGCANAQPTCTPVKLDIVGEKLPPIRHINDMKMSGDTLFFVYESEDGFGQRLLRRAIVDFENNILKVSPDMGKRDDSYFVSYMPYPFIADNGSISVISQDDGELYTVENDTSFVRTKKISDAWEQHCAVPTFSICSGCFYDRYRQICFRRSGTERRPPICDEGRFDYI